MEELKSTKPVEAIDMLRFQVGWPQHDSVGNPFQAAAVQNWHRASCFGRWNIEAILRDYHSRIDYSWTREMESSPGKSRQILDQLIIRLDHGAFIIFEGSSENGMMSVWANSMEIAQERLTDFRKNYSLKPKGRRNQPKFEIIMRINDGVDTHPVFVTRKFVRRTDEMALHYGADFPEWAAAFIQKLKSSPSGVSIFRGQPGTGKTSSSAT